MRHRAMAAFLVTFGPPGFYRPGQATVQTAVRSAALARTKPLPQRSSELHF